MKQIFKLSSLAAIMLILAFTSCKSGSEQAAGKDAIYGVKSGIVTYKPTEMMGIKITQVLYFDDFGKKQLRETVSEGEMMGQTLKAHSIDILDGNISYHYDLENTQNGVNMAEKVVRKVVLDKSVLEELNLENMAEDFKKKMDYKEEGTEKVAGLEGKAYSIAPDSLRPDMRIKGVHYKNIPLKMVVPGMEMVAEKVELDAKIPADKFKLPEGYTVQEEKLDAAQQLMDAEGEDQVEDTLKK